MPDQLSAKLQIQVSYFLRTKKLPHKFCLQHGSSGGLNRALRTALSHQISGASTKRTYLFETLTGMKHQGLQTNSYGQIDDLKYTYFGNQLLSVTDVNTAHGPADFRDYGATNAVDYTYNANGSLVTDANKGITAVVYNHLDLPEKVTLAGGREIVYLYDAAGTKLAKVVRQAGTGDHRTDYVGDFVYQDGVLEFFATPDGRCVVDGGRYRYEYHYRDHLGNLRLAFSDLDGDGDAEVSEVLQEAAYYPYGMRHEGLGTAAVGAQHRFLFQGKELERDFGVDWMDFGARRYDAQVGRLLGVDAYASKYVGMSPYEAFGDDPLRYVDPGGESLKIADSDFAVWFNESYYPSMSETDRSRIDALRSSDVIYEIGYANLGDKLGETGYDFKRSAKEGKDIITVQVDNKQFRLGGHQYATTVLGGELQHAFQFETGKIGFAHLRNRSVSSYTSVGYDLDDELESQIGSVNSLYGYLQFKGADLDDPKSKQKVLMAEFPSAVDDDSLNSAIGYKEAVMNGSMSGKDYIYSPAIGYSDLDFSFGSNIPGGNTRIVGNPLFGIGQNLVYRGESWKIVEIKARSPK